MAEELHRPVSFTLLVRGAEQGEDRQLVVEMKDAASLVKITESGAVCADVPYCVITACSGRVPVAPGGNAGAVRAGVMSCCMRPRR